RINRRAPGKVLLAQGLLGFGRVRGRAVQAPLPGRCRTEVAIPVPGPAVRGLLTGAGPSRGRAGGRRGVPPRGALGRRAVPPLPTSAGAAARGPRFACGPARAPTSSWGRACPPWGFPQCLPR